MVRGKVRLSKQGRLVTCQPFPRGFILQIPRFDGLNQADKIHGCSVFILNLVKQVDAWIIGKEPVFAAVKHEVLRTRRQGHDDHEHAGERGFGPMGGHFGQTSQQRKHTPTRRSALFKRRFLSDLARWFTSPLSLFRLG